MFKKILNNNFFDKEIVFLFVLYLSLLIGFFLNENSTGGAINDYLNQKEISKLFALNFKETFLNYDNFSTRHSPVLIVFLSLFEKLNLSDFIIRLIYLHLNLILPIVFFNCLKLKFENVDKKILIILVSLIFLSPTFRSLSIWPDSRILGILFFTIGIYFFLKFEKDGKFKYSILNIFYICLSSYLSPNFSVFSILFFIFYLRNYELFSKEIFFIIILNFTLALPALYYIFVLEINFLLKSAAINFDNKERLIFNNITNDILITYSIIFFYILPFLILRIIKFKFYFNLKSLVPALLIFISCIYFFDYKYEYSGGGIFFKFSNLVFQNNLIFFFVSFLSIYIINQIFLKNKINYLILILIFLNNPQYTIYHKYFDPFLLISFFTIFSFNINLKNIYKKFNHFYLLSYFGIFLFISYLKTLWTI